MYIWKVFEGNLQIIMNYNIFLSTTIIEDPTASVPIYIHIISY
jgi:hypothetical protein